MGESQAERVLPDQSFRCTPTKDRTLLKKVETAIAAYAGSLMQKLGKYQTVPNQSGFFPHGVADVVKTAFTALSGAGPGTANEITPNFPTEIPDGEMVTIIETSEELTLTHHDTLALVGRTFRVSREAPTHVLVFGDVVYIRGRIAAPGKHIVIVAREVRTMAVDTEQAEIDVSGPAPEKAKLPKPQATIDGDGTGSPAGWYEKIFETVHPIWAGIGKPGPDGQDGQKGDVGKAGGEVYVLCDTWPSAAELKLCLSGGTGQDGQAGQPGGNGGAGGRGFLRAYREWYDKHDTYEYVPPGLGGSLGFGGSGGPAGPGGASGNCIVVVNRAIGQSGSSKGPITVTARPGNPGLRGARGGDGSVGPPGQDPPHLPRTIQGGRPNPRFKVLEYPGGYVPRERTPDRPPDAVPAAKWGRVLLIHSVYVLSAPETPSPAYKDLRGIAQVGHLHMLLETARLRYLQWDAYRFAQDSEADDKKDELTALLDFLGLGWRLLPIFSAESDLHVRDGIQRTLLSMTKRFSAGLDYFGQTQKFVPLGSPDMYFKPLSDTLVLLKVREDNYQAYSQALKEAKSDHEQRTVAIGYARKQMSALEQNINVLRGTLLDYVKNKIPAEDKKVRDAQAKLSLASLTTWVTTCFGLTPEDFIDCVFNLAFVGSPLQEGKKGKSELAGHGAFTAFTTISSQSAKLITKAVNTLPNDEGQPVDRKHLLRKVDRFSKKLSTLKEAYRTIKDAQHPNDPELIQLDDPDAYRLVVAQQEFNDLLDQFSTKPEAQAATDAMNAYVDAVQTRNAVLEDYNTLVYEHLRVAGDISTTKGQAGAIEQLMSKDAAPDLPMETAFVTALYNRTRERCIEQFYLASRAYRFWSLKPETALYETLKLGNPNEMHHMLLSGATEQLLTQRTGEVTKTLDESQKRSKKSILQPFPSEEEGVNIIDRTGISVILQPKNVYSVRFLSAATSGELPTSGKGLVIVALIDLHLHIRIFDTSEKQVVDKDEDGLLDGVHLTALKRYFEITRRDVLCAAYGWTRDHVDTLSPTAQRQAVIERICQLTGEKHNSFKEMNDYELTGHCAVLTFLRVAGIRDDAGLKGSMVHDNQGRLVRDNHRNTLITENGGRLGKPGLQGMDNHTNVQLGLEWAKPDFLRRRLAELSAEEQEAILDAVAVVTEFPLARGYPKEFAELKQTGTASFRIPAPSQRSIKQEHPFAPFYNTRITKVRAWIRGVKTNDPHMCHVLLQPQGSEVVCDESLRPVPFIHDPIHAISFIYEYPKVRWNESGQYVENPGEALAHGSMSGTLTCTGDYKDSAYVPLIGPFTEWKISLKDGQYNAGLDRTNIEAIHLEFHGFQQTYEGNA